MPNKEVLQARFDALEREKSTLNPNNPDDQFRIRVIEQEQQSLQEQIRTLDQEEKKAAVISTIQLPQNYDELTGLSGLNAEIENLINQAIDQLQTIHSADMEQVHTEHKAKIDQMQAAVEELSTRASKLQHDLDLEQTAHSDTKRSLLREQDQRKEAEQCRDNAVKLKEEAEANAATLAKENDSLKSQIDELEGMVKTFKKPAAPTGGLQLTSTLKLESDEERKARLERDRLETINRNMDRFGLAPLKIPEYSPKAPAADEEPEVTQKQLDDAFPSVAEGQAVVRDDAGGEGVPETQAAVDGAGNEETRAISVEERLANLENRVEYLEHQLKGQVA